MAGTQLEDKIICNIELVEIITEGITPKTYYFDTAEEATYSPTVSEGKEDVKRIKNRIAAINRTEDIQYGSSITLKDNSFSPEVLEVVDGGTVKKTSDKITGYTGSPSGTTVARKPFTLNLYTSEKSTSGGSINYYKFSYPNCKGTPAKFSFKDGEFMTPEYTIVSRPSKGAAPFDIDIVQALPNVIKS